MGAAWHQVPTVAGGPRAAAPRLIGRWPPGRRRSRILPAGARFLRSRRAQLLVPGEELDRAVEPVTTRAADPCALHRAVRGPDGVAVLDLRRKPAPHRAPPVHICRAVQEHHVGVHHYPPIRYLPLLAGPG